MFNTLNNYTGRFNAMNLRERALIGLTLVTSLSLAWWGLYAESTLRASDQQALVNIRLQQDLDQQQSTIAQIQHRIENGVHVEKQQQLRQLKQQLDELEQQLKLKTVELIEPIDMLRLLNQLIYKDSRLTLLNLKRLAVKPAIENDDGETEAASIYRHVLELKFSGKFADIVGYMQSMEALDWRLLWDEIEIIGDEYPVISVKLVLSTLSTRKEWIGV